ncbi:MAG: CAP domain-containing protein [Desulfovibrio sp.]|nr:CAP domain-containing protein [Desulfovibrio sp.]
MTFRPCAAVLGVLWLVFAQSLPAFAPSRARAGVAADDQTVLYYLVEAQRQYAKTCGGTPMEGARPLVPSEALRTLAGRAGFSGALPPGLLAAHGLEGAVVFYATAAGATPRQAFAGFLARDCAGLMAPSLRYIGASSQDGVWSMFLADREPVFAAVPPPGHPPLATGAPFSGTDVVPLYEESSPVQPYAPPAALGGAALPDLRENARAAPSPESGREVSSSSSPPTPARPPATMPVRPAGLPPGDLLGLINEVRSRGGLCGGEAMSPVPPLVLNSLLAEAAKDQADHMASAGYFASTRPDGATLGDRLTAAGYVWADVAELLAGAPPPAARVLDVWLGQENRCRILLSPDYTEAGYAFEERKKYWVLTLARPMPEEPGAIRLYKKDMP